MIEFKEDSWVVGIWFAEGAIGPGGPPGNFMMCLQKDKDGTYFGQYRFRYFKDDNVFDSDDERHWYKMSGLKAKSDDEAINKLNEAMGLILTLVGTPQFIRVCGDGMRAAKLLSEQTWGHMKETDED